MAADPAGHRLRPTCGTPQATGGNDSTVILWDVTDPARPQRIGQPLTGHTAHVRSVVFASGGHTLATGDAQTTVILWDVTDPARPQRIGQPLTGSDIGWSVAFAPDGYTLAIGSGDGTVILWDMADPVRPQQIGQPLTGSGRAESVAFAPSGHTLATANNNNAVILWNLAPLTVINDNALQDACERTDGALDPDKWKRAINDLAYENACAPV